MNKKIISLSLAILVSLGAMAGCGGDNPPSGDVKLYTDGMAYSESSKREETEVYSLYYDYLGGSDVMPIGGFYVPYASGGSTDGNEKPDLLTDYYFNAIKEAGVNTLFYSPDRWATDGANTNVKKALDLCEKYNLGYYVDTYYVLGQLGTRTEKYPVENMELATDAGKQKLSDIIDDILDDGKGGKRNCVLGILGVDEPFTDQLPNLGVLHDAFYSLENTRGMDIYINSIGYWAGENNFWGYSDPIGFDDYLKKYFEIVKPSMLSVTQYPYTSANTPETTVVSLLNDMLSVYRKYANENKVPFWRMLQAGGQWNDTAEWIPSVDPYPSEGELLYDVNSSLAYGAKAIEYFPLVQPYYFAQQEGGTYDFNRCGLIGADGNLTQWYYYAKRANAQVAAVDEYLMNAMNEGVIVHGKTANDAIVANGKPGEELIQSGTYYELNGVSGDDCIVGCFNYKGKTALYVVNYNRKEKANVTLSFNKSNYRYTVIQRAVTADVVGGTLPLTLDAGEGALIVLK